MEEFRITISAVVAHVLMTAIPWFIGLVVGGGLGVLFALGIRALFSLRPALRRPAVLLPWRTAAMGLLMAGCSPFIFTLLGLGVVTGGLVVAISVAVLAMAFAASILVEHWHASPPASRWVAGARTLAVASGLIAAGVGLLGGGGLGHLVLEATRVMEYGPLWQGLVVILAFALMLDLALGLGQMFTLHRSGASAGSAMGKGTPA